MEEDIVKTLNWFMGDVVQAKISEDSRELLLIKGSTTLALTIPNVMGAWNEPSSQTCEG